jgi:thiol-disulfide isomerase/thioredoxin
VLQFWLLVNVMRQNGRLLSRMEAIEAKAGIGAGGAAGLPVGAPAPAFALTDLDGATVTLDSRQNSAETMVLFFFEPGCPGCEELLPEIGECQSKYRGQLAIVPIGGGKIAAIRESCGRNAVSGVVLEKEGAVSDALFVRATPSAIALSNGRIASPVAAGGDAIRSLIRESALPRVRKGQRTPSLQLSRLDGGAVDLSLAVQGRRTLLLFWSPFCGFCNEMLDELKIWENDRPAGSPNLVVVSTGSAAANRSQGFTSSVFLDSHSSASHVFGADGTPAAVLLDEDGIVISRVRSGRHEVLELAGVH